MWDGNVYLFPMTFRRFDRKGRWKYHRLLFFKSICVLLENVDRFIHGWGLLSHFHWFRIMGAIASQITCLTIVYSTVYSDADQRKHQSSASLAFVWGIHRGPVKSPHKWPVTRKMLPFDDVIMVEVWEWTSNFIPHIIMDVNTHPCWNLS